ncbi:MAG: hypothetical protein ACYTGF_01865 [Planctomycetota bacterium]|jgi:hypothetical protein
MKKRGNKVLVILFVLVVTAVGVCVLRGCGLADPAAQETFLNSLGTTSITVYPAYIRRRTGAYDEAAAERLAEFLRAESLAEVTVTDDQVPITGPWHRNQARMLRESAESFAAYVDENPIATDYALLGEYLFGREAAGGIHCYVLDAEGTVVYVVLLNDHWEPFAEVMPRTVDECTDVLINVLRDSWQTAD